MTASEIVAQAKDLPVVSETARKLAVQLNQPNLHRDELVHTLRCDNVLTAKILRVCNSAECSPREPVESIDQALLILGDDSIFRIVCAIGFGDALGFGAPGYATEANGLWNHSLTTAVGTEYLAETAAYGDFFPAAAFTAGLLHDIGKIVVNKVLTPKDRADIRTKMAAQSLSRVDAERQVLGADHCEVGACLLQKWTLPESIIEAVAHHHTPVIKPTVKLSALVYLANAAAHLAGGTAGWENHVAQITNIAATTLELDGKRVEELIAGMHMAVQTMPQLSAAA